jgi:hypothetical protein
VPYRGVVAGYPEFVRSKVLEQKAHRYLLRGNLVIR